MDDERRINPYEKASATLAAWICGQCIPHAVLIEAADESAALRFAFDIAGAAMCASVGEERDIPCGTCRDCVKLGKGVHPDLSVYEGEAGKARSFHVDTVREIRSKAFIYPNEARVKVFILKNAHDMTIQAQNALLKVLEEPPGTVLFILTCVNKSALLETVLSRVAAVYLGDDDKTARLVNNTDDPDKAAVSGALAARLLADANELGAMAELFRYERDRTGFLQVLANMRREFETMLFSEAPDSDKAGGQARRVFTLRQLNIIDIIDDISLSAAGNGNISLISSVLCARIRGLK